MTDQTSTELVRQPRSSEGQLAGVCVALADRWRVDPLLIRTAVVLAALSGGVGAIIYAALWLWMPPADGGPGRIEKWLPAWRDWSTAKVMLVVSVASIVALAVTASVSPFGAGPLIVLGLLVIFGRRHVSVSRQRHETMMIARAHQATPAWHTPQTPALAPMQTAGHVPSLMNRPALNRPTLHHQSLNPSTLNPSTLHPSALNPSTMNPSTMEFSQAVTAWQTRIQQIGHHQVGTHDLGQAPPAITPPAAAPASLPAAPKPTPRPTLAGPHLRRTAVRPLWWFGLVTAVLAVAAQLISARLWPGNTLVPLAAALVMIGVALVIGAFVGRPRLMIAAGLVTSLLLVPLSMAPVDRQGPVAQSLAWTTEQQVHDVSLVGQTWNLDVSNLHLTHDRTVTVDARSSGVSIKVSPTTPVTIIYTTNAGAMVIDTSGGATDASSPSTPVTPVHHSMVGTTGDTVALGPSAGPRLTIVVTLTWSAGAVYA